MQPPGPSATILLEVTMPGIRHGRRPPLLRHPISEEEYLAREEQSDTKHEYVDGFIYAMAGASDAHVTITGNLTATIRPLLRGRRCKDYASDMRLAIPRPDGAEGKGRNNYYYPDFIITCSEADLNPSAKAIKKEPCLVVEVSSPGSTDVTDRTEKLDNYRKVPSVQQYWLIAQDQRRIIVVAREGEGWRQTEHTNQEDVIPLPLAGLAVRLEDLYEKVFDLG